MAKRKWFDCMPSNAANGLPWESAQMNTAVFNEYFMRLKNLAISVFEWKNLPETIDPRFLELTLFEFGFAVFFYDDILENYLALTTQIGGTLDVYRIPKYRRAYAPNGYNRKLSDKDSVLIFNDYMHTPMTMQTTLYAKRLYSIERALDVNISSQRFPILIKTTETQRMTLKQLYMQYDGNEPVIFADKSLMDEGFKVIKTDSPYVSDKLMRLKHEVWNEALTYFGIENSNTDKRERLITDEVQSNLGAVEAQRFIRLNARRQACDKINKKFGLNIEVDYRSDFSTIDSNTSESTEEVTPNVEVHD